MASGSLKDLRAQRSDRIARVRAMVKEQNKALAAVRGALADDQATVPEISQATGLEPRAVMWWIATLRKYGHAAEAGKAGGYFKYELAAEPVGPACDTPDQ